MSLEARKSALEAQRLLTAYQASDEAAVETCVDALRKVGVHQASAFSTREYDLAQLTRALDACDALADVRAFVEEREQARDRVDGACVRNALRLCQPETSQVARAMGSVFVPRSPVDDVLASPSAVADASTAALADDVRYVTLPVRAGAGAVAPSAAAKRDPKMRLTAMTAASLQRAPRSAPTKPTQRLASTSSCRSPERRIRRQST